MTTLSRRHFVQTTLGAAALGAPDLFAQPAATGPTRALYYGASDGHCWQVTSDPAQAAGFFLSEARSHG